MKNKPIQEMTVEEIAAEINARLKKIEASPRLNKRHKKSDTQMFYQAGAWVERSSKVGVLYVSYQGKSTLTKPEAGWYLEILRSGFVGSHHSAFQERGKALSATDTSENFFRMAEGPKRPIFHDGSADDGWNEGGIKFAAATSAYYKLVEAVSILVPKSELGSKWNGRGVAAIVPNTGGFYPTGTFPEVRSARPEVQAALSTLFVEINKALKKSGELGQNTGTNLLVQMARGKLTADDLRGNRK